jgi:DNA adenine methylase
MMFDGGTIKRPVLRYYGGKFTLAPWIISHFPEHTTYVEPYGGAASVLLRKTRSKNEVYNDLDGEIVLFFNLLRSDEKRNKLADLLRLTPFSREECDLAKLTANDDDDDIERVRKMIVRSMMGFTSAGINPDLQSGFKINSAASNWEEPRQWARYPDFLNVVSDRLNAVVIDNRDAIKVIGSYDKPDTLFYVDPPYLPDTRNTSGRSIYRYEKDVSDHERLLSLLNQTKGMVVLSGYDHDLYNDSLKGWKKTYKTTLNEGHNPRNEVLWIKVADLRHRQSAAAYKTHAVRRSKNEIRISDAIAQAQRDGLKITKSNIAQIAGISREQVYRNYTHMFANI